jgi:dienelactone hydrolase
VLVHLRCRKSRGESFVITFIDRDGSVSYAGAIAPPSACVSPDDQLAPKRTCPILVASHGTGVTPASMADAFKHKPKNTDKDFTFGVRGAWVLTPSRHGAHNHEGIGAATIDAAIDALVAYTSPTSPHADLFSDRGADGMRIISAGHSMGGHGSWLWATHHPDRVVCAAPAAGWISKVRQHAGEGCQCQHSECAGVTPSHCCAARMALGVNGGAMVRRNITATAIGCSRRTSV